MYSSNCMAYKTDQYPDIASQSLNCYNKLTRANRYKLMMRVGGAILLTWRKWPCKKNKRFSVAE